MTKPQHTKPVEPVTLHHPSRPQRFWTQIPNNAAKRIGPYKHVSPAALLFWMALLAAKDQRWKSKTDLARICGTNWGVARQFIGPLERAGLLRIDGPDWHVLMPGVSWAEELEP